MHSTLATVAQVIHLPILQLLPQLYITRAVCDISRKTADLCASKFHIPHSTTDPYELIKSLAIDLIFNLTSDEFHAPCTIAALEAGKHVIVEKLLTLGLTSGKSILEAAKKAKDRAKVFVGYMRRYAPSFVQAFKREIATIPRIMYAQAVSVNKPSIPPCSTTATSPGNRIQ